MKYHFVINPRAGKGDASKPLSEKITEVCERLGIDYTIYFTTHEGDGTDYVKNNAEGGEHSFFACGGDGTLCEVANGIMSLSDRKGVYMGVIPIGTGNDFVRNFTNGEQFHNIEAQLSASPMSIDLIGCNDMYAVNMINVGFDCEVVCSKERLQSNKLIPSRLAYVAGLILTLIKKPGVDCRISVDGGKAEHRQLLLTTCANGEFCGGGFHSNPESEINNGRLNILTVNDLTRLKFISIVSSYKKGTHLKYTDMLSSRLADKVKMEFESLTNISVDGEIIKARELVLSAASDAVRFLVPEKCEYIKKKAAAEAALSV